MVQAHPVVPLIVQCLQGGVDEARLEAVAKAALDLPHRELCTVVAHVVCLLRLLGPSAPSVRTAFAPAMVKLMTTR